ncbi:MAG: hypothetical protein NZZ41_05910 [Candidatus Dojkabacteria bacterium]|nr:hypothetical protein [Candidatus Dojkabacteria bacterium]
MNKLNLPSDKINLEVTLLGGQTFSWRKLQNNKYLGIIEEKVVKLEIQKNNIFWQTYPESDNYDLIQEYFGIHNLDYHFEKIRELYTKDVFLSNAINTIGNLIILKQPKLQTILSFLLSSVQRIETIQKQFFKICQLYGNKIQIDNNILYTFPSVERLVGISESELRNKIRVGFRAKYIKLFLNKLKEIDNNKVQNIELSELIKIKGIGNKIFDCIGVYSYEVQNRTPIDRWTKKFLKLFYNYTYKDYEQTQKWMQNYFGFNNVALAGQYLFEYIRNKNNKI